MLRSRSLGWKRASPMSVCKTATISKVHRWHTPSLAAVFQASLRRAAHDECVGHARGRSIRSLRNRLLGGERRPWRPSLLAPAVPPSLLGRTLTLTQAPTRTRTRTRTRT